jgi:succinoglycan biosynthesis protein ExoA
MALPSVAVMLPVLNEVGMIDRCLETLTAQDYDGPLEILVVDGGSSDGTRDRLEEWRLRTPRLRVIANPRRRQSHGLNIAAAATDADILVRGDAHTTYAPDYVRRSVEALADTDLLAVGPPMVPDAQSRFGQAVARAFRTRLGIGPAAFHHSTEVTEADTVYLGAMTRATWLALGGLRTFPSGVAEDADLYYRLRSRGGKVIVDPRIVATYRPRETLPGLWRQFFRYGQGKAEMLHVNGEFPSWRPLAPLALIVALIIGLVLALIGFPWPLIAVAGLWLMVLAIIGRLRPLVMLAIASMHLSYGLGLIRGLLSAPERVRRQVLAASPPPTHTSP